jgi:release factor glutamine methyltransferase
VTAAVRTTAQLLDTSSARLARAGVASPRHDAQALLAHVLGVPRGLLAAHPDVALNRGDRERLAVLLARREQREPLQHLLGSAPFRHLELAVGPGVFVPRPESEVLVDEVLLRCSARGWSRPLCVDLCAGAGALGLSVAHEVPGAQVHLVERSPQALSWLYANVAARSAAGDPPVHVHPVDVAAVAGPGGALAGVAGRVDVVLANPPYVVTDRLGGLEPEVAAHDPREALDGGCDGLAGVCLVLSAASRLLRPGGVLAVEHGDDQGASAAALVAGAGFDDVLCHVDLAGRQRFVTGVRVP